MKFDAKTRAGLSLSDWTGEYANARGPAGAFARAFNGTTQYGTQSSSAIQAYPFSVAIRFRVSSLASVYPWGWGKTTDGGSYHVLNVNADGTLSYLANGNTATTTNVATAGPWQHALVIATSATDRRVVLNGDWANSGTNTTSSTPAGLNTATIAALIRTGAAEALFAGDLSEYTVWNVALSQAEAQSLAMPTEINGVVGYRPAFFVRTLAVRSWVPLFGLTSPEPDQVRGLNVTLVAAPSASTTRPSIVYPPMTWDSGS